MTRLMVSLVVLAFAVLASFHATPGLAQYQPAAPATSPGAAQSPASGGKVDLKKRPLDLNSATEDELMRCPGSATPTRRRSSRTGRTRRKDELVRKKIIPEATYDKIKEFVIAKQSTTPYAPKKQ